VTADNAYHEYHIDEQLRYESKDVICSNGGSWAWTRCNSSRALGEFQGSYFDDTWQDSIPGELMQRAYESRLIDCTWHCTEFCGASPTGVKDRTTRTHNSRTVELSPAVAGMAVGLVKQRQVWQWSWLKQGAVIVADYRSCRCATAGQ
jgi:hypothetical protein